MNLPPVVSGEVTGQHLSNLIGIDARVVIEIGANDGWHTHMLLDAFPEAKIYAFEPDPRGNSRPEGPIPGCACLKWPSAVNPAADRCLRENRLRRPEPPDGVAYFSQGWDQSGSLRRPNTHKVVWPWCKFEDIITVPVRRLDTWTREHGVGEVDFIWADMQGAEGDLIGGGEKTLAGTRYLYTEYSNEEWYEGQPNLQELLDMLPNFAIHTRFAMDVLLQNTAQRK